MRNHSVASWLLRRFLPAAHAEAMLGDLLESSGADEAKFRRMMLGTVWSLGWRTLVAFVAAAFTGGYAMVKLEEKFVESVVPHHATSFQQSWVSTTAFIAGGMCMTACFALVRYGWKDRIARLTLTAATLGACATLLWWVPAVPIAACAGFLLLSVFNLSRRGSRGAYGALAGLLALQPLVWFGGFFLLFWPLAMVTKKAHTEAEFAALKPILTTWFSSAYMLLAMLTCAACAKARRWVKA